MASVACRAYPYGSNASLHLDEADSVHSIVPTSSFALLPASATTLKRIRIPRAQVTQPHDFAVHSAPISGSTSLKYHASGLPSQFSIRTPHKSLVTFQPADPAEDNSSAMPSRNSSLAATASLVSDGTMLCRVLSVKTPRKVYCKVAPALPNHGSQPKKCVDANSAAAALKSQHRLHKVASINKDAASNMLLPGEWVQGLMDRTNAVGEKQREMSSDTLTGTLFPAYRPGIELR
jgi:hypothetical protein